MWTIEYDNSDTSSCQWWTITDGNRCYRTYRKEDADFLVEKLNQDIVGLGYIAFYEFEDDLQWWIVKREFWDENGYIDDNNLDLIIPEFGQDMESCYSYQIGYPNNDLHLQGEKLKALGFEIRKWKE